MLEGRETGGDRACHGARVAMRRPLVRERGEDPKINSVSLSLFGVISGRLERASPPDIGAGRPESEG